MWDFNMCRPIGPTTSIIVKYGRRNIGIGSGGGRGATRPRVSCWGASPPPQLLHIELHCSIAIEQISQLSLLHSETQGFWSILKSYPQISL